MLYIQTHHTIYLTMDKDKKIKELSSKAEQLLHQRETIMNQSKESAKIGAGSSGHASQRVVEELMLEAKCNAEGSN